MQATIKPYPQPNPSVEGSTSRFSTGFEELDGVQVEKLAPVVVDGKRIDPYIPSPELKELVRIAQILRRPVLIKGEPGSGKTQLAVSVAFEWYGEEYKNHFFEWQVKSTAKARDGLYTFDHVARLRRAQMDRGKPVPAQEEPEDLQQYRQFGPMGKAFLASRPSSPAILLIDEIDKADIDFPNDLLLELDERRFSIPETGENIRAEYPPLIFITSNDERELPEAFLRRCLFCYIEFPNGVHLKNIIRAHVPELFLQYETFREMAAASELKDQTDIKKLFEAHNRSRQVFVEAAIGRFEALRKEIEGDPSDNKRVSTSELIDWLKLYTYDIFYTRNSRSPDVTGWVQRFLNGTPDVTADVVSEGTKNLPFYYYALLKTKAGLNRRDRAIGQQAGAIQSTAP